VQTPGQEQRSAAWLQMRQVSSVLGHSY
jgi:hypothetical protein